MTGWGIDEEGEVSGLLDTTDLRVEPYLDCYLKKKDFFGSRLRPGKNFCATGIYFLQNKIG